MTIEGSFTEHYHNLIKHIRFLETKYHRPNKSITLLAVSKSQPLNKIHALIQAGQLDFGENYLQESLSKLSALTPLKLNPPLNWHFIGRLQSNKLSAIATHFNWVHTVTTLEQAIRLSHYRALSHAGLMMPLNLCIQINISQSKHKQGLAPETNKLEDLFKSIARLKYIKLRGLMTIPDPTPDSTPDPIFDPFKSMAELFAELQSRGLELDTLSMGMSQDFEAAISAGATIIRIGSRLFGPRA